MKIQEFFSKDHERLDEIFFRYRTEKNQSVDAARNCFEEFQSGLLRHIAWEEEILFPLFEEHTGAFNHGPVAVMRMEHIEIKSHLKQIHQTLLNGTKPSFESEEALKGLLSEHNYKEENILYPWMDRTLGDKDVDKVFDKIKTISSEAALPGI